MSNKIFISWSGTTSKAIATALHEWLPNVIQLVVPWMSAEDIDKGARWSSDIATQLEQARVGIICLTPENLTSPWILFEAGALSKTLEKTFVCPYLYGVDPANIRGPLVQFQVTIANRDDTNRLLHTINKSIGESALPEERIDIVFAQWWPILEKKLESIKLSDSTKPSQIQQRPDRDLLEEILELTRGLERARQFDEMVHANEQSFRTLADIALSQMRTRPLNEDDLRKRLEEQSAIIHEFIDTLRDKKVPEEVISKRTSNLPTKRKWGKRK